MKKSLRFFLSFFLFWFVLRIVTVLFGNRNLFLFINEKMASRELDFLVLKVFLPLFSFLVFIPLLMLLSRKKRKMAFLSLLSGFTSYFLAHFILKPIFRFPRPYAILGTRTIGPWHPNPFSFPSSTAMLVFGLSLPIFERDKKWGSLLLTLAFLVSFSVIYTGFHFPNDVLGGMFFALLINLAIDQIRI